MAISVMRFDLRAPARFGTTHAELYGAALDLARFADERGFDTISLSEHHGVEDGFLPSPLLVASAMAARTERVRFGIAALLAPLYDPVKLAEDAAVAQLATQGRLVLGVGGGYRPAEFESFGRRLEERWRVIGETIELLRRAWTGEPFTWQGRRVWVTPRPDPPPPILLGGGTPAAARRAARIADGWLPPLDPRLWAPYREECLALGKPDPGPFPAYGPTFLWVAEDDEAAWRMLEPHVRSQIEEYGAFTREGFGEEKGPYRGRTDAASLRTNRAYRVMSPAEVLALVQTLGPGGVLLLNPLLGGIAPAEAWKMLKLFEREVLPALPRRMRDTNVPPG